MFLFATHTNPSLARRTAQLAGLRIGRATVTVRSDGESYVKIDEDVKHQNVVVMGATFQPDKNFMELVLLIQACRENGAKHIQVLIPYFGYARQDRVSSPGECVSAKLMAGFIKKSGADTVVLVDVHSPAVKRFFQPRGICLSPYGALVAALKKKIRSDVFVVVAPDRGARHRAQEVADLLHTSRVVVIKKHRLGPGKVAIEPVADDVRNADIVIVDDMVDTGGTLIAAIKEVRKQRVASVSVLATHAVLSGPGKKRLGRKDIDHVFVTNTIPMSDQKSVVPITVVSVAKLFAQAIKK